MKTLVTGASGFIGSGVVRALRASGHEVRCFLRAGSSTDRIAHLPFERAKGDVLDAASVHAAAAGCEAIVHLASLSSWSALGSAGVERVAVEGTRNVLSAAREAGGLRVVHVSSVVAVNGSTAPRCFDETAPYTLDDEDLPYARGKRSAEALCLDAAHDGLHVVIVNPAEVYGPRDTGFVTASTLVDFARSRPVIVPDGGTSVVHVDDVATGIVRALERGRCGERYILGGENVTVRRLAELTLEILGRRGPVLSVPNGILRALARAATRLSLPLPFEPNVVPYATRYWFVDAGKASRELGVSFRSARQTLEPTLAWLRENGSLA
ncbi:MAG: NAD-dependent epimerase/dehydratase family protein [Acidobacteriota bacterium]